MVDICGCSVAAAGCTAATGCGKYKLPDTCRNLFWKLQTNTNIEYKYKIQIYKTNTNTNAAGTAFGFAFEKMEF